MPHPPPELGMRRRTRANRESDVASGPRRQSRDCEAELFEDLTGARGTGRVAFCLANDDGLNRNCPRRIRLSGEKERFCQVTPRSGTGLDAVHPVGVFERTATLAKRLLEAALPRE